MILEEFIHPNYDPFSKDKKSKMLRLSCDVCGTIHERGLTYYHKMKENELFDKDYCNLCWRSVLNNREEYKLNMSKIQIKIWKSVDKRNEMSNIIRSKCEETGYMLGNDNPMKDLAIRRKTGVTRSARMTDEERNKYSISTRLAWEAGKFIGVDTCRCKWYDYRHSNGIIYKVQGTWELRFIEWLDKNKIGFRCHRDRIKYIDDNEKERNYYPDFYINEWKSYVDIKSDYSYKGQERKFDILQSISDIPIKLLFKKDLIELGIKI
jgi:hypothetical protein